VTFAGVFGSFTWEGCVWGDRDASVLEFVGVAGMKSGVVVLACVGKLYTSEF